MIDADTLGQLRDSVRRYVRERLVPLEAQVADDDRVPPQVLDDFRQMGLFGLSTPEQYGGLGLPAEQEIDLIIELSWASAAFRTLIGINLGMGSQGILVDGTSAQKDAWLARIASGEVIVSFCLTEPDSGSDSAALRTRAVRDGDHYLISGSKRYITNAPLAGLFLVMAPTSAPSWCRPACQASPSARTTARWAMPAPGRPMCTSTTCAFRQTRSSAGSRGAALPPR